MPANKSKQKADGHFTNIKNQALIIKTADCMPVFLSVGDKIFGLHIGWRGLAQKILTQALEKIDKNKEIKLWIGPHVHQKSYGLDLNSIKNLFSRHSLSLKEADKLGIFRRSFDKNDHFLIDLDSLLLHEAMGLGIKDFTRSDTNTYTSPIHYSHRRYSYRVGTNYSFIIKT
ncbi:MAG: polyphenol oxidase family protein [Bdellovibrionales bacterium]|nr:polyphenol oxidase family protein [Bdellovibrionales bacterium]